MTERTARLALPLLVSGQGQKDVTHNEALVLLDALVHLTLEDWQIVTPPAGPEVGQCWIVPPDAQGAWAGRAGAIAQWTAGGWRYAQPREGMRGWLLPSSLWLRRASDRWLLESPAQSAEPAISPPAGGGVVDAEARASISALLAALARLRLVGS